MITKVTFSKIVKYQPKFAVSKFEYFRLVLSPLFRLFWITRLAFPNQPRCVWDTSSLSVQECPPFCPSPLWEQPPLSLVAAVPSLPFTYWARYRHPAMAALYCDKKGTVHTKGVLTSIQMGLLNFRHRSRCEYVNQSLVAWTTPCHPLKKEWEPSEKKRRMAAVRQLKSKSGWSNRQVAYVL